MAVLLHAVLYESGAGHARHAPPGACNIQPCVCVRARNLDAPTAPDRAPEVQEGGAENHGDGASRRRCQLKNTCMRRMTNHFASFGSGFYLIVLKFLVFVLDAGGPIRGRARGDSANNLSY